MLVGAGEAEVVLELAILALEVVVLALDVEVMALDVVVLVFGLVVVEVLVDVTQVVEVWVVVPQAQVDATAALGMALGKATAPAVRAATAQIDFGCIFKKGWELMLREREAMKLKVGAEVRAMIKRTRSFKVDGDLFICALDDSCRAIRRLPCWDVTD